MKPVFFASQEEFRQWLEENHETARELIVGYYKVKSSKPSMTWTESVDQALCFGWIDGIRRSVDEESYCIRFTPRRKTSTWSAVNIKKVETLTQKGLMHPAGMASFEERKENNSEIYSYENKPKSLSREYKEKFRAREKAWAFFTAQPPSYKKQISYWIMSAKQEKTRLRRLEKTIRMSGEEKRIGW